MSCSSSSVVPAPLQRANTSAFPSVGLRGSIISPNTANVAFPLHTTWVDRSRWMAVERSSPSATLSQLSGARCAATNRVTIGGVLRINCRLKGMSFIPRRRWLVARARRVGEWRSFAARLRGRGASCSQRETGVVAHFHVGLRALRSGLRGGCGTEAVAISSPISAIRSTMPFTLLARNTAV